MSGCIVYVLHISPCVRGSEKEREREREDLRSAGLLEADAGGVHSRRAERQAPAASSGSDALLRAASVVASHRWDADEEFFSR